MLNHKVNAAVPCGLCRLAALLLVMLVGVGCLADSSGKWKAYQCYADITEIEPTGSEVFVLASGSLFSYNPNDGSLSTYDKVNALSDNSISHIAWSEPAGKLIIIYENSNIDLLSADGSVINVPDLYMKSVMYSKAVSSVCIHNKIAYLAADFGIVKLDVGEGCILDTYQLGFSVEYCYVEGNYIYAVSKQQGTYRGNVSDNLLDKGNWQWYGAYVERSIDRKNVYDSATKYWWTVNSDGKLTYYTANEGGERTYMTEGVLPDGPASNNFYHLFFHNSKLYATGGIWNQITDGMRDGEVHVWNGTQWSEFDKPSDATQRSLFIDALCLDFDPADDQHVMVGTKNGLFEYRGGKCVNLYNKDNSLLYPANGGYTYTMVPSVKYDASGNLWVLNPSSAPIKCLTAGGQWVEYSHSEISSVFETTGLFISSYNGLMWFINNQYQNTILCAYDYINDKLTAFGPSLVNQDGTSVSANYIYSPVEDKEGNIWVGTDAGPLYLSASTIENGGTNFTQYKVARNDGTNTADYLLSGVHVLSVAIDGGNRKWMGTDGNGVFLISSDCDTQLAHFTADNSPLLSNIVQDIVIDGSTGEVFFATDKGLCSYSSTTTEPADEMTKDNVYAYPNPVRPDYTGVVTVVGLTFNADVKIVTSNGVLVNKGRSTGGTYTWDCTDLKGKRVASGVYMVETADQYGDKGTVCKIAVVN